MHDKRETILCCVACHVQYCQILKFKPNDTNLCNMLWLPYGQTEGHDPDYLQSEVLLL